MTVVFEQQRAWDIELYNVGQEKLQEGLQEGLQKGKQQGLQEGLQKGLQKGKQEGAQKERVSLIKKMLKVASPTELSAWMGIPQDEIDRIAESLN